MKRIHYFALTILAAISLASCGNEDAAQDLLTDKTEDLTGLTSLLPKNRPAHLLLAQRANMARIASRSIGQKEIRFGFTTKPLPLSWCRAQETTLKVRHKQVA